MKLMDGWITWDDQSCFWKSPGLNMSLLRRVRNLLPSYSKTVCLCWDFRNLSWLLHHITNLVLSSLVTLQPGLISKSWSHGLRGLPRVELTEFKVPAVTAALSQGKCPLVGPDISIAEYVSCISDPRPTTHGSRSQCSSWSHLKQCFPN